MPLKGLRYLLRAYARLLPQYPGLELLVVSKTAPRRQNGKLVRHLGIADRVRFVNGITTEQMVRYYAEAAIAVVPSVYEGFGLPAGEAMACGVPVVSSDGGALPEVVGDAGVIVPPGMSMPWWPQSTGCCGIRSAAPSSARWAASAYSMSFAGTCAPARWWIITGRCCMQTVEFSHFPAGDRRPGAGPGLRRGSPCDIRLCCGTGAFGGRRPVAG